VNDQLEQITQKEESVKKTLARNSAVLDETKSLKMTKTAQTFAKMKAGSAANILSNMSADEAVMILQSLKAKTVGQILTKMDPQKASELVVLLGK
jgi:flagellar motility protein MotE (MotC chaperone)